MVDWPEDHISESVPVPKNDRNDAAKSGPNDTSINGIYLEDTSLLTHNKYDIPKFDEASCEQKPTAGDQTWLFQQEQTCWRWKSR